MMAVRYRHGCLSRRCQGFTLVELLVALMVFSLLTIFAYRALNMLSESRDSAVSEARLLSEVQKFLLLWERDVRQADWSDPDYVESSIVLDDFNELDVVGSDHGTRYFVRKGIVYRQVRDGTATDLSEPGLPLLSGVDAMTVTFSGKIKPSGIGSASVSAIGLTFEQSHLGRMHKLTLVSNFVLAGSFSSLDPPGDSGNGEGQNVGVDNDIDIPAAY
ncbi:MAG: prepilin-type N-terminal cleavage/methylation domain-containing protein [Thiothrix sp.]|nr:prepilin-type N-terminal cleavage/methylation domain-containing protein [Thiothrix sp.]HPQ94074.1 prepilin-type N-terminal cleavage/methylation domain-containing protein [Thiolinea sp.]